MLHPLPLHPESHRPPLWSRTRPPPPWPLPGSPVTHPCCPERVMLAAALAPSRKQQGPQLLPHLGHPGGRPVPALIAQLLEAKLLLSPGGAQGSGALRQAG